MPSLTAQILQPCAESWAAMTLASGGRHCAACQKTVVDFTQKTDAEILAYFDQQRSGRTCGRFRREQVGQSLAIGLPVPVPRRWQGWLTGLLVSALTAQSCHTTTSEPAPINQTAPQKSISGPTNEELARYPLPIEGRVINDYTQQPVGGVRVQLQGTSFATITGADGLFAFPAAATPRAATHRNPYVLQLLADGYPPCERILDYALPPPNQLLQVVRPSLPVPTELMGDVEVLR